MLRARGARAARARATRRRLGPFCILSRSVATPAAACLCLPSRSHSGLPHLVTLHMHAPPAALPARLWSRARQSFNSEGVRLTARVTLARTAPLLRRRRLTRRRAGRRRSRCRTSPCPTWPPSTGTRCAPPASAASSSTRRVSRACSGCASRRAQDNTLTAPYASELHPPLRAPLADCLAAFGGAVCVLRRASRHRRRPADPAQQLGGPAPVRPGRLGGRRAGGVAGLRGAAPRCVFVRVDLGPL